MELLIDLFPIDELLDDIFPDLELPFIAELFDIILPLFIELPDPLDDILPLFIVEELPIVLPLIELPLIELPPLIFVLFIIEFEFIALELEFVFIVFELSPPHPTAKRAVASSPP